MEKPKSFQSLAKDFLFFFLGLIGVLILIVYTIITIPAFLYQCFVSRVLLKSRLCPKDVQKLVSPMFGTAYAAELMTSLSCSPPRPSRNAIVHQSFIGGIVPPEELKKKLQSNWIESRNEKGDLKYPELQLYIYSWMGYLFWRKDPVFALEEHVNFNIIRKGTNLEDLSKSHMEALLNKPFTPYKSPWEMHIFHSCDCFKYTSLRRNYSEEKMDLQNYTPTYCDSCGTEEMTIVITRIHHCLGDGISFMFCLLQGLFEADLFKEDPRFLKKPERKEKKAKGIMDYVQLSLQLCRDIGCVVSFVLWRANDKTRFHVPDSKKSWHQIYETSHRIPLQRMKQIKDHFGVGFSVLVTSCISKGISKQLTTKQNPEVKNFVVAVVFPLPTHPFDKWINDICGTSYKLPIKDNMDPVERLFACNEIATQVNRSLFTQVVFPTLVKLLTYHIYPIVKFVCKNRVLGGGITNVCTPSFLVPVFGKYKLVKVAAAAGGNDGINGALFCTCGYHDQFYFIVTAESASMERQDVKNLINDMVLEADALYKEMEKSKLEKQISEKDSGYGFNGLARQRRFSLSLQKNLANQSSLQKSV